MRNSRRQDKKRKANRERSLYSHGELNSLIDDVVHPLKKMHWAFILVDEALHMINEGDIEQSARKFVQFSLPEILQKLLKKRKSRENYFPPNT
jgi:hypothetical protein